MKLSELRSHIDRGGSLIRIWHATQDEQKDTRELLEDIDQQIAKAKHGWESPGLYQKAYLQGVKDAQSKQQLHTSVFPLPQIAYSADEVYAKLKALKERLAAHQAHQSAHARQIEEKLIESSKAFGLSMDVRTAELRKYVDSLRGVAAVDRDDKLKELDKRVDDYEATILDFDRQLTALDHTVKRWEHGDGSKAIGELKELAQDNIEMRVRLGNELKDRLEAHHKRIEKLESQVRGMDRVSV